MTAPRAFRAALIPMSLGAWLVVSSSSCATSGDGGDAEPVLFLPDSGSNAQAMCVETKCPAPFATCPGTPGPCTTDLDSNVAHCGACGAACPKATPSTHGTWLCSGGQCRLACDAFFANCNGLPDDGCEVATASDPKNCGFCGNACKDGELCWKGACGCPNGFTQCGDECVQTSSDNDHCGACNTPCKPPTAPDDPRWRCGAGMIPSNTSFHCTNGACPLECNGGYEDCNEDFCGDGCEIDLLSDSNNCGACGNKCQPYEFCKNGACACPSGTTRCGNECVDLARDTKNCGACGRRCPAANMGTPSNGGPSCENGACSYVCFPGFADCDKNIANGCEVDLTKDQLNCGACKTKCDARAGQPCVKGVCLTKPCENGPVR